MIETKGIIERLNVKKILETVNNEGATIVAVRHCCDDEEAALVRKEAEKKLFGEYIKNHQG